VWGLDVTPNGAVPRARKGETRRGITRLAGSAATESWGDRVEGIAVALKP
jgi:hypothetical protein